MRLLYMINKTTYLLSYLLNPQCSRDHQSVTQLPKWTMKT